MMNIFAFFSESFESLRSASKTYWRIYREWFLKTPERSLSRAYNAAVMIKMVEEEFSEDGRFSTRSVCINDDQKIALKVGFKKKMLSILKLRLAEFKFSCSILGILDSDSTEKFKFIGGNVGKLRFIDQVLERYVSAEDSTYSVPYQEDEVTNNIWPENSSRQVTIDVQVTESISE